MKNPITRPIFAGMTMLAVSALHTNAALVAYDGFDYPAGTIVGDNGGTGWSGAWANGTGGVASLSANSTDNSLSFSQSLITDGSKYLFSSINTAGNRDLVTTINMANATLYYTMLLRVSAGADVVDMRTEFYTGAGATSNMRANVGITNGALFVSAATGGYAPAGNSGVAAGLVAADTTYLLAMKRNSAGISASLILADGDLSKLAAEPATWDVVHVGASGVTFNSFRIVANGTDGGILMDEVRIATSWNGAVTGLAIPEPSAALLGGLGLLALLRRRR